MRIRINPEIKKYKAFFITETRLNMPVSTPNLGDIISISLTYSWT
jgi:hypothetical protein